MDLFDVSQPSHTSLDDIIKVLLVDDEVDVHAVTKFALSDYMYMGHELQLLSAHNTQEAKNIISENMDIALILLDVVMEETHSGLDLIKFIRETSGNKMARIIIRTGQPGYAPERDVVLNYDINDYVDKSELTNDKLYSIVTASIRSYVQIVELHDLKESLEGKVEERTKELKELNDKLEIRVKEEIDKRLKQEELLIQQSKMAAMGEMLTMISHQLKQPITIVNIIAHSIEDDSNHDKIDINELQAGLDTIKRQTQFMGSTINEFKSFLKPSKQKQIFDLKESVDGIITILDALFKKSKIGIFKEYINEESERLDAMVYGYANEFKHVILNILSNAIDALNARFREDEDAKKKIFVRFDISHDTIKLIISDNGGGIPSDVIGHVFENHFTTKGDSGTGIGLYMAKIITENHMCGKLEVQNGNDGAEFTITLKRENI